MGHKRIDETIRVLENHHRREIPESVVATATTVAAFRTPKTETAADATV